MINLKAGERILFYAVVLIPGRSGTGRSRPGPFRWLAPRDTAREAAEDLRLSLADDATMGFVVRFPERGDPDVMINYIMPASVRNPIEKYVLLCDLIDREHPLRD